MTHQTFLDGKVELYGGDSREVLKTFPDNHFDSVVCDPPYALVSIVKRFGKPGSAPVNNAGTKAGNKGDPYARAASGFMGKSWDVGETAFAIEFWAEVYRTLKPGGHVVAFSGTRTYHRLACAIEDAGFEIRDQLAWCYGSGFPKSHDVSKAIDKAAGKADERGYIPATGESAGGSGNTVGKFTGRQLSNNPATDAAREWQGWGTALKPSWEPICLARKPLAVPVDDVRDADAPARMRSATVAENVLEHGTGALNIDGCRVGTEGGTKTVAGDRRNTTVNAYGDGLGAQGGSIAPIDAGRWPANIVHDGSDEVVACFPDSKAGVNGAARGTGGIWSGISNAPCGPQYGDSGSAARFFYTAKADKLDRIGSKHPTVKPVDLMQWLVRLVTPKGGLTLDPFAGSGSTGEAAWREGMRCVLIEREEEYQADIAERMKLANAGPATRKARAIKQVANDNLPLFGGVDMGGKACV